MARYIDADKLIEKYKRAIGEEWNKTTSPPSWSMAWECVVEDIEEEPTAEVVEIPCKCEDCKNYNGHRYCHYFAETVLDDDYCSYGEKRGSI